jgi:hypothetical protein
VSIEPYTREGSGEGLISVNTAIFQVRVAFVLLSVVAFFVLIYLSAIGEVGPKWPWVYALALIIFPWIWRATAALVRRVKQHSRDDVGRFPGGSAR